METAAEGIWVCDDNGIVTYANARMADILGLSVDELVGRKVHQFFLPADLSAERIRVSPHLGQNIREYGRFSRCLRTSCYIRYDIRDSIGRVRSGRRHDHATGALDGNGFSAVRSAVPGGGSTGV
jgi:PAS domain S-box-containing protein